MSDYLVDTNVLLVASAAHPYSPFDDTHVPIDEQKLVFEWVQTFGNTSESRLVMDDYWRIYAEYRHKLTDQDYGLQVIHAKLDQLQVRVANLEWDGEVAVVPAQFSKFDRSDRKFLACALSDPETISIVNAADTDWLEIERELQAAGVRVIQILDTWLRASRKT